MKGSTAACTMHPAMAASAAFPSSFRTSAIVSVTIALSVLTAARRPVNGSLDPGFRT